MKIKLTKQAVKIILSIFILLVGIQLAASNIGKHDIVGDIYEVLNEQGLYYFTFYTWLFFTNEIYSHV